MYEVRGAVIKSRPQSWQRQRVWVLRGEVMCLSECAVSVGHLRLRISSFPAVERRTSLLLLLLLHLGASALGPPKGA